MPASRDSSRFFAASSQGPREEQQDSAICLESKAHDTALLVVGDGVGGKRGGRLASQKLTELAQQIWQKHGGIFEEPDKALRELCLAAHDQINEEGHKLGISPRTTVVALYLSPTHAWWIHSGDSRLYHFRAGELVERTEDHSLLEIMVQRGMVKEEEMGSHPEQGALLQSLGGDEFVEPSAQMVEITSNDGFLLCTDGFWERTRVEEMRDLLFSGSRKASARLDDAVRRAVERNGPKGDNVTVLIALPAAAEAAIAGIGNPNKIPARLSPPMMAGALLALVGGLFLVWYVGGHERPAAASAGTALPPAVATPIALATPEPRPKISTPAPVPTTPEPLPIPEATPPPKPTPAATPSSGPFIPATTPPTSSTPPVRDEETTPSTPKPKVPLKRFYDTVPATPAPVTGGGGGGFHTPPPRHERRETE